MARRSAPLRLLFGLALLLQTLIGPAAPMSAQSAPTVTFTCGASTPGPCSVPVGGTLTAAGANFPLSLCGELSATVSLVNAAGAAPIILGTAPLTCARGGNFSYFVFPSGGGTFTLPMSGAGAVPAGTYNVRASVASFVVDSRELLTVTPPTGGSGTLSGFARCNIPPLTLLPNATVTIFSGSALVATTTADARGSWSVSGVAPNATFTVRYSTSPIEGSAITCGVGVTTNPEGSTTVSDPSTCPSPPHASNRVWNTALPVAPQQNGSQVVDTICDANESRWFRVAVFPGQRVTAEIDDPSFDLTLGLYKDIQQVSDALDAEASNGLTLDELQNITTSIPHDVAAPDATAPDATAPDATAPDATAPDATAPDATAPDATAPDATAPDATAPDATAPDATAPDATAGSYSAALATSLVAFSDKPGSSPEFVRRHTWDNTGNFYIRVRGHNGAFDETHPFSLRITVVNHNCTSSGGTPLNLSTTPFSPFDLPSTLPQTLIITNTAAGRFPTGSDTTGMLNALRSFAARSDVNGFVLDLAGNSGLAADYAQWDANPQCAPAANIVANQIQAVVNVFHAANPALPRNVVIAGGDRVIPFARVVDEAGLSNESDYSPAVFDASESQAALKTGYFLSQDLYGSFTRISVRDHDFNGFDIPVGRLVENPPEIVAMLNAYIASNGLIAPTSALVTGYDFLSDGANVQRADLEAGLGRATAVDGSLIQPEGDGPLANTAWSADALRQRLFGSSRFNILAINAHFSGNTLLASDMATRMRSSEIASVTDGRFVNSLILSMGCHSGYNIVDPDATPGTQPVDWAQAFALQGATLIGGAGYQYGNSPFIKYSEVLLDSVTRELRYDSGPVPLGQAIVNAKRAYVHGGMNGIDEKALAELTLYGLPMTSLNLPAGRIPRPAAPPPVGTTAGASVGLSTADLAPTYTLNGLDRVLSVPGDPPTTTTATYFTATYPGATDDVQTTPGNPVVPRVLTSVAATGRVARGVVLLSADYTDLSTSLNGSNPFRPLVDGPSTEVRAVRPAFGSSVFTPVQLVNLAEFEGQFLVQQPFQFKSNPAGAGALSVFGTGRRFDSMSTRVYYTNRLDASALAGPPIVYSTRLTKDPTNSSKLNVDVSVGGLNAAGVEDVFATYTAEPTAPANTFYGHWRSLRLTQSTNVVGTFGFIRHYTGTIDTTGSGAAVPDLRLFVQAVSGTGLVTLATNNGAYYRFVRDTATLGSPKATTALALTQPSYTATYRSTLDVSARLTNAVTGAAIADKALTFTLGRSSNTATTDAAGTATATLPVLVAPDQPPPQVAVGFAEDQQFLGSGDRRDVTINRAATFFSSSAGSVAYGDSAIVATLFGANRPLREVGVRITLSDGRALDTLTDGFGRVLFDTLDFGGVQPGTYPSTIDFAGNDRYLPSSLRLIETVTAVNRSLLLDGTTGYAEAPHSPDLNITGDWTIEAWFRDMDPNGFNHEFRQLIDKGDRDTGAGANAPYFIVIGNNQLLTGVRSKGIEYRLTAGMVDASYEPLNPREWHHVAITFIASKNLISLWMDGRPITSVRLAKHGYTGNTLPVQIGRNGPETGKYWLGEIDDVRIWNIARSGSDITASFRNELTSNPAGLVANWKFNERPGTLAAYSSVGNHTASLSTTGASFVNDVHP